MCLIVLLNECVTYQESSKVDNIKLSMTAYKEKVLCYQPCLPLAM